MSAIRVHGASGIIHFALDSWVTRVAQVVGISPQTPFMTSNRFGGATPINASASLQRASQLLWSAASQLNHELEALAPAILSPTSASDYTVGFS